MNKEPHEEEMRKLKEEEKELEEDYFKVEFEKAIRTVQKLNFAKSFAAPAWHEADDIEGIDKDLQRHERHEFCERLFAELMEDIPYTVHIKYEINAGAMAGFKHAGSGVGLGEHGIMEAVRENCIMTFQIIRNSDFLDEDE